MASEVELTTGERRALVSSYSTFRPQRRHTFGRHNEVKKKIKKTNAIRKLFGLADGDLLIDISADIKTGQTRLSGRLFIMDKYILFFSDMFNVEQKVIIPMMDVFKLIPDPVTNSVEVEVTSSHSSFLFILSGKYKEDVLKYFKTMDSTLLPLPKRGATSPGSESITSEDEDDDECLEWISRAAKEEGFLNSGEHQLVITEEFPISIKRFYDVFLKDETFFNEFYKHLGRTEINMTSWQSHEEFGYLRQFCYRVKVNSPIGPPTTMMDETQRYYNQSGDPNHIILEISHVARDVKYGDSFRVESKFDILGSGNTTTVKLEISVGVSFIKKIYVPGVSSMIKSKSIEDSKSSYTQWVAFAKKYLEEHPGIGLKSGTISANGTGSGSGRISSGSRKRTDSGDKIVLPSTTPNEASLSKPAPTPASSPAPTKTISGFTIKQIVLLVILLLLNIYFGFHVSSVDRRLEHLESIITTATLCKNQ